MGMNMVRLPNLDNIMLRFSNSQIISLRISKSIMNTSLGDKSRLWIRRRFQIVGRV